jgi:hypothetical protein
VLDGGGLTKRRKFGDFWLLHGGHAVAQLFHDQLHQFFHGQVVGDMLNV